MDTVNISIFDQAAYEGRFETDRWIPNYRKTKEFLDVSKQLCFSLYWLEAQLRAILPQKEVDHIMTCTRMHEWSLDDPWGNAMRILERHSKNRTKTTKGIQQLWFNFV